MRIGITVVSCQPTMAEVTVTHSVIKLFAVMKTLFTSHMFWMLYKVCDLKVPAAKTGPAFLPQITRCNFTETKTALLQVFIRCHKMPASVLTHVMMQSHNISSQHTMTLGKIV